MNSICKRCKIRAACAPFGVRCAVEPSEFVRVRPDLIFSATPIPEREINTEPRPHSFVTAALGFRKYDKRYRGAYGFKTNPRVGRKAYVRQQKQQESVA